MHKLISITQAFFHLINIKCAEMSHHLIKMNMLSTHMLACLLLVIAMPVDKIDTMLIYLLGKTTADSKQQTLSPTDGT